MKLDLINSFLTLLYVISVILLSHLALSILLPLPARSKARLNWNNLILIVVGCYFLLLYRFPETFYEIFPLPHLLRSFQFFGVIEVIFICTYFFDGTISELPRDSTNKTTPSEKLLGVIGWALALSILFMAIHENWIGIFSRA